MVVSVENLRHINALKNEVVSICSYQDHIISLVSLLYPENKKTHVSFNPNGNSIKVIRNSDEDTMENSFQSEDKLIVTRITRKPNTVVTYLDIQDGSESKKRYEFSADGTYIKTETVGDDSKPGEMDLAEARKINETLSSILATFQIHN
ncbi:hypothetical protein HYT02_03015 [Candidatus Gottesmanbacteria bacterium]|nr:hypothetical protein [Candidatus Gottesmanbacteria bacterium]